MAKYRPYPTLNLPNRTWPNKVHTSAPTWCSVDLRDGNQALATPMNVDQKLELFHLLVELGFKEIEVGFPSASQIEYDFLRKLIEEGHIPEDVYVQVLTQSRKHLIERTFESLRGAKNAILHLYNSTSEQQRRITFNLGKEEIKQIALDGTQMVIDLLPTLPGTNLVFQYSPESFTATEMDYGLEVCQGVMDLWNPEQRGTMILNLPATVELSTPNIYADQIEWFCQNLKNRDRAIISLHTHNDRGTGVAATELGMLAGADRVEGTLFGNGERTGNVDIVTLALNLYTQGIDPKLDFSNLPRVRQVYEECTLMDVHPRHPYGGDLVFTAFSGSHQDAISKGMALVDEETKKAGLGKSLTPEKESHSHKKWRESFSTLTPLWDVPYLPLDPQDIGRSYQAIIRINSQSGKGGVAYILEQVYGIQVPRPMQPELGAITNRVSDQLVRELTADEIFDIFQREFVNRIIPYELLTYNLERKEDHRVRFHGEVTFDGNRVSIDGVGNGPIDGFVHGLADCADIQVTIAEYSEQAIGTGSGTEAAAFICLTTQSGNRFWGVGRDTDTSAANFAAILSAVNRAIAAGESMGQRVLV